MTDPILRSDLVKRLMQLSVSASQHAVGFMATMDDLDSPAPTSEVRKVISDLRTDLITIEKLAGLIDQPPTMKIAATEPTKTLPACDEKHEPGISFSHKFAASVCSMFEEDPNWSVDDLQGAREFFDEIGFEPSTNAVALEVSTNPCPDATVDRFIEGTG